MTTRLPPFPKGAGLLFFFAVSALLISGCGGQRAKKAAEQPGVGQPLMFLELEPLPGAGTPISKESLKGRVTLINFWATWCGPCRIEYPQMAAMAKKLSADPKFQYLSVNLNDETGEELINLVQQFQREQHADHPTWIDSTSATRKGLGMQLGWGGTIPLTLLIDDTGTIRGVWNGYMRGMEVEMEALARELL